MSGFNLLWTKLSFSLVFENPKMVFAGAVQMLKHKLFSSSCVFPIWTLPQKTTSLYWLLGDNASHIALT